MNDPEIKMDAQWIQKIIKETLENLLPTLFNEALKKVSAELEIIRHQNSELCHTVQSLQDKVEQLEKQSQLLEKKTEDLEQESRLTSVVMVNEWPENKLESTLTMATNYIQEALKIDVNDNDILKCHRIGKKRESGRAPRPILLKFASVSLKTEVLTARRRIRKFESENYPRPVYINEDLTENRRSIYVKCRALKKIKQIKDCWTLAGRVFIKLTNDLVKPIDSVHALDDI